MPGKFEEFVDWISGDSLPIFTAGTRDIAGLRPNFAYSSPVDARTGRRVPGIYIGQCGLDGTGPAFYHDPGMNYLFKIVSAQNSFMTGHTGQGKSAQVKYETYQAALHGIRTLVTDLKGEYTRVADKIPGSKIFRYGTGSNIVLNPLDPVLETSEVRDLLESLAITVMHQDKLDLTDLTILLAAIKDVRIEVTRTVPILENLVERLAEPTEGMAHEVRKTTHEVKASAERLFYGLKRLLDEDDLGGMFNGETSPGLFEATPLLVMNCEGLNQTKTVLMVTMINFLTYGVLSRRKGPKLFHRIVHDESWKLSEHPAFAIGIRQAFKLGRSAEISNRLVMHAQQNIIRSSKEAVIRDLINDTDTFICYNQNLPEVRESAEIMGLTEAEVELIPKLPDYTALWKFRGRPGVPVRTIIPKRYLPMIYSDTASEKR